MSGAGTDLRTMHMHSWNRLRLVGLLCLLSLPAVPCVLAADKRPLNVDDFTKLRELGAPQMSPDGERIAYTVSTADLTQDKRATDIWMTNWRDGNERQLTFTPGWHFSRHAATTRSIRSSGS
jgi:hypothetical protein